MSRLENFLGKDKEGRPDLDRLQKVDKKYQCQQCEKYCDAAYFDEKSYMMYWYCDEDHESKVSLIV